MARDSDPSIAGCIAVQMQRTTLLCNRIDLICHLWTLGAGGPMQDKYRRRSSSASASRALDLHALRKSHLFIC
jgi:hypothetical protein